MSLVWSESERGNVQQIVRYIHLKFKGGILAGDLRAFIIQMVFKAVMLGKATKRDKCWQTLRY